LKKFVPVKGVRKMKMNNAFKGSFRIGGNSNNVNIMKRAAEDDARKKFANKTPLKAYKTMPELKR
jgi:hypothetical protein